MNSTPSIHSVRGFNSVFLFAMICLTSGLSLLAIVAPTYAQALIQPASPTSSLERLDATDSTNAIPTSSMLDAALEPTNTSTTAPALTVPKSAPVILKTYRVDSTAYTSSVEECDDTPFITADGSHTHDGIIAANFLPFGTKVLIPDLFGNRVFEVHDRMNARYTFRIDVWMEKKQDMKEFGIHHNVKIEVIKLGDNTTQWRKLAMR